MKKVMMALIAATMISGSAMAQDENKDGQRPDPKEMIQKRTDAVVEKYGLDEAQAAKLLELNTEYAEKMPMMGGRGGRQGGPQGGPGQGGPQGGPQGPQGERPDSVGQPPMPQPQPADSAQARQEPPQGGPQGGPQAGQGGPQGGEEMKAIMEEYDKAIAEIMTEEQYAAYKKDAEERMKRQPRGGRQGGPQGDAPQE